MGIQLYGAMGFVNFAPLVADRSLKTEVDATVSQHGEVNERFFGGSVRGELSIAARLHVPCIGQCGGPALVPAQTGMPRELAM
jgi:hypothetical protein